MRSAREPRALGGAGRDRALGRSGGYCASVGLSHSCGGRSAPGCLARWVWEARRPAGQSGRTTVAVGDTDGGGTLRFQILPCLPSLLEAPHQQTLVIWPRFLGSCLEMWSRRRCSSGNQEGLPYPGPTLPCVETHNGAKPRQLPVRARGWVMGGGWW